MKKTKLFLFGKVIFLFALNVTSLRAYPSNPSDSLRLEMEVKKAASNEDWAAIEKILASVDTNSTSGHLRFIKGHALLALNKNNESICYFINSNSDNDLKKWFEWTSSFLAENVKNPIALYFQGDAYARLGDLDSAIQKFTQAISLKGDDAIYFNARGVVYSLQKHWDKALLDLNMATTLNTLLADAFVNYGTIFLKKNEGSIGALNAFEKALNISPDFLVALNGKACSQYVSDNWDTARISFVNILEDKNKNECLKDIYLIINLNFISLLNRASESIQQSVASITKLAPGMPMEQRKEIIQQLPPEKIPMAKAVLRNAMEWNQTVKAYVPDESKFNISASLKISGIKPTAEIKASYEMKRNDYKQAVENLNYQTKNYEIINTTYKNVPEQKINNFQAFYQSHTDKDMRNLTRPGGVSTEEINATPVDKGHWNVITLYGLLYSLNEK